MPVRTIFQNLEAGLSVKEIIEVFDVTEQEVKAGLRLRISFDNGTPHPIALGLVGHEASVCLPDWLA